MDNASADYKKLYCILLTAIDNALAAMDEREYREARYTLIESKRITDGIYMQAEHSPEKWDTMLELANQSKWVENAIKRSLSPD